MLFTDGLESQATVNVPNSRVCLEPGDCVGKLKEAPEEVLHKGDPLLNPQEAQSLEVFGDPISDVLHWCWTYG